MEQFFCWWQIVILRWYCCFGHFFGVFGSLVFLRTKIKKKSSYKILESTGQIATLYEKALNINRVYQTTRTIEHITKRYEPRKHTEYLFSCTSN